MEKSVFQKSPVQFALDEQRKTVEPVQSAPEQATPAEIKPANIDQIAVEADVPANLLSAIAEMEGNSSADQVSANAQRLKAALAAGKKVEDIFSPDVLDRAAKIGTEKYGAETKEAPDEGGIGQFLSDSALQVTGSAYKAIGSTIHGLGEASQIVARNVTGPAINAIFGTEYEPSNLLEAPANVVTQFGERGHAGISQTAQEAVKNSTPDGNLFKPSTWTAGENPSLRGYFALSLDVLGSMLPVVAASVATGGSAIAGGVAGALQGGGAADQAATEIIDNMAKQPADDGRGGSKLEQESAYYRELLAAGKKPEEALRLTKEAAGQVAFLLTAPISGASGSATAVIINPASKIVGKGSLPQRIAGRTALGAGEEGSAEAAETVATRSGVNVGAGTNLDVAEGTFGDFVLGALGGGTTGAVGGALSQREGGDRAQTYTPLEFPPEPGSDVAAAPPLTGEILPPLPKQLEGPMSRSMQRGLPSPYPIVEEGTPQESVAPQPEVGQEQVSPEPSPVVEPEASPSRVRVVADGIDPFEAVIEAQDEAGLTLRTDDGSRYQIGADEIAGGGVSIAPIESAVADVNTPEAVPDTASNDAAPEAAKPSPPADVGTEAPSTIMEPADDKTTAGGEPVVTPPSPSDSTPRATPTKPGEMPKRTDPLISAKGNPFFPSAGAARARIEGLKLNLKDFGIHKTKQGFVAVAKTGEGPDYMSMSEEALGKYISTYENAISEQGGWGTALYGHELDLARDAQRRAAGEAQTRPQDPAGISLTPEFMDLANKELEQREAEAALPDDARPSLGRGIQDLLSDVGGNERISQRLKDLGVEGARTMQPDETGRPADGKPILGGDVFATAHGTVTTPYPKGNGLNGLANDRWLAENAARAAEARGDNFNGPSFRRMAEGLAPAKKKDRTALSPSDRDSLNQYLWTDQPPVIPKATKPLDKPGSVTIQKPEPAENPAAGARKTQAEHEAKAAGEQGQDTGGVSGADKTYGASNTFVSADRAAELRKRLKAKLRNQINSGIDPEVLAIGAELAAFHIEAGARKFSDFAQAIARDLDTTVDRIRPYLRAWYNGARDMMEDGGHDISGTDGPDVVRSELARIGKESGSEPGKLEEPSSRTLGGAPSQEVRGTEEVREARRSADGSGGADASRDERSGGSRNDNTRSVGDDARALSAPSGGTGRERGAGERGSPDVQRDHARTERDDAPNGQGSVRDRVDPGAGQPAGERASDFAHADVDEIGTGGAKTKFKANVAAIRLLKDLETSGRLATREDQAILARYVGWGGIPQAFERTGGIVSKGWEKEAAELKAILTPEEMRAASASTRNAHYTSPEIVRSLWAAMKHMGFDGGRVLEPSIGVGNFFGMMPADMRNASALHGVELDNITGGIAKHLYPAAKIATPMGFQDYVIPDGHFDAVIGNPPFGSEKLYDGRRKDLSGFSIHNYFFAKAVDGLRPGGVLAMVVTNRMMDATGDKARQYISDRADLIGAIRLPNNAFLKNAGTEVTTDIIFLRKREEGSTGNGESWMKVSDFTDKSGSIVPLNEYFHRHPEMMLGEFGAYGTMYRPDDPALVARDGQDTASLLNEAISRLPQNVMTQGARPSPVEEAASAGGNVLSVRVGSMFMDGDTVKVRDEDSLGEPQASNVDLPSEKARLRVTGMIGVRDHFADLRKLQLDPKANDAQIEAARGRLNEVYDKFVRANGPINLDANKRLFRDDPSWPQIAALEDDFDRGVSPTVAQRTGEKPRKPGARKAAVFSKRTQRPYSAPTKAKTAKDALVTSLSETGRVNMPLMERLYGKPEKTIVDELGDLIFKDPVAGHLSREEYLSGNVKKKLAEARQAAKADRAYERNVTALEAVQPADIDAVDIRVKPGAHWLPRQVMQDFAGHISGDAKPEAIYNAASAKWVFRVSGTREADARWATERASLAAILDAAANQKMITIRDKVDENTTVVNEAQTQLANDKVQALTEEWQRWIWQDDDRRNSLSRLYNDMFNTDVQRQYDGAHLKLPGKISDDIIALRPHQANAIWRVVQSKTTLLDHVVGAGKTFTMVGAAMELRRTGLARKPMFVVPNHLVSQWASDFIKLYPGAQVLATTKKDFDKDNRKRLFARVATGDWDAVIVAHSSFGKVEVEPHEQSAFIEEQIADLEQSLSAVREIEGRGGRNVKQIEAAITARREKMKRLLDAGQKDDSLYWGELGVDALFVDEAHEFKNLEFSTSMQRVAGLGNPSGSQKAADLYLKTRQVLKATGGRNVVFATGTPISNTMAEMFTMQRYLDYQNIAAQGTAHFDAWARQYGEIVTDWELSPSGQYKMNSRFAKFVNMPELMQRYLSFADVVNRDDINRMLAEQGKRLPVPKLKGGKPENVVVSRSNDQARYIGEPIKDADGNDTDQYPKGSLVWRAENLPKKAEKGADNMLKVMSDARKAALDMRLIEPDAADNPNSKIAVAANNIKRLYDRWHEDVGTQLVFIDLSTPKGARADEAARIRDLLKRADEGDDAAASELEKISPDEIDALNTAFSVYDDLKAKLIGLGIPESEVAFIHDAKTDLQKEDLFGKVRSGRVRVLLGSTPKMGAGTNVQDRLVALHHLDAPWRPSDLEQREGRIIRQGNKLYERDPDGFEVEVLRYATKQTLDSRMWQTIEGKARFIEQVRKGATGEREIEDIGGEASNAAEMKAASSGNPLILEEMTLRQRVKRLETERRGHDQEQFRLRDTIRRMQRDIKTDVETAKIMRVDAKVPVPAEFEATIADKTYSTRKEVGAAILAEATLADALYRDAAPLGTYGGFKLTLDRTGKDRFVITLAAEGEYQTSEFGLTADPQGLAQRIVNAVADLDEQAAQRERRAQRQAASLPGVEAEIREWAKSDELDTAKAGHRALIDQLRPKKKEAAPADNAKQSVAEDGSTDGMTTADAQAHLRNSAYGIAVQAMIDAGRIVIHENVSTLPVDEAPDGRVQGMTTPDGVIHLVAGNLTPDTIMPVLAHEMFHAGTKPLLGEKRWNNLLANLERILKVQSRKPDAERSPFWRDAIRRVTAAGVDSDLRAEEMAAYAIENREHAPNGIRSIIDNLIGVVKDFIFRKWGKQLGDVTPGQLRAMTLAALQSVNVGWVTEGRNAQSHYSIKNLPIVKIPTKIVSRYTDKAEAREAVRALAKSSLNGKVVKTRDNTDVLISWTGIKHGTSTANHKALAAMLKMDKLIEASTHESRHEDKNSRNTIKAVHTYIARAIIGGEKAFVRIYVRELIDGTRYYDHLVIEGKLSDYPVKVSDVSSPRTTGEALDAQEHSILPLDKRELTSGNIEEADQTGNPQKKSRFSMADDTEPVLQARQDKWFKDWLSDKLTWAMGGGRSTQRWNILGLAPLRPMLEELTGDIPAARSYLRTKQAMDTLRNEWHSRVADTIGRWKKFQKNGDNAKLMDMMHESTLAQVDPTKPFEPLFTAKDATTLRYGKPDSTQYREAEARAQRDKVRRAAHKDLKSRLEKLSPEALALYEEVRDTYSDMADNFEAVILGNMDKALKIAIRRAEREHRKEMQRIADDGLTGTERDAAIAEADKKLKTVKTKTTWNARWRLNKMREQFETNRLAGPYFPLGRFGNLFATVRDKEGKVVSFSRFESPNKLRRFVADMKKQGYDVQEGALADPNAMRNQVDPNFVADVEAILEGSGAPDALKDQVWQKFLERLPDYSIRKNRIHRLGRAGFNADAMRAFANNLFHGAHQLARTQYGMDLAEHIAEAREQAKEAKDPVRAGLLLNEMDRRHAYVMNPEGSSIAQALTSAAFIYQLSVSPAAAIVNLSQTVMLGVPILGAYQGGLTGASKELTRALHDFTMGRGWIERSQRLTGDEKSAIQAAYSLGVVDKTQAHDLAGVSESGVEYSDTRQKVMAAASFAFHHAERLNREVTFLAAYRLARQKGDGHGEAIDAASQLTWKTHFDYQNTSRPRFMQQDVMKVAFVFRNYSVNMLFRLFRDTHAAFNGKMTEADRKEARRQLFGITGMLALNAGVKGVWLFGIAMTLAGIFFGAAGNDEDDPEEELHKAVHSMLGPHLGAIVLDGLPGYLTGTDLTSRIGMPDLWFRSPDRQLEGEDAFRYWQDQMLGATSGMAQNMVRGFQLVGDGKTYRGIETMAPKFIKDLMRAGRFATEGVTTLKGDEIIPADQISWADVFKQAIGFTPAQVAEAYQLNRWQKNRETIITDKRKDILQGYGKAIRDKDTEGKADAMDKVRDFNKRYPSNAITGKGIVQSLRSQQQARGRSIGGVNLNPKLRPYIEQNTAPSFYRDDDE